MYTPATQLGPGCGIRTGELLRCLAGTRTLDGDEEGHRVDTECKKKWLGEPESVSPNVFLELGYLLQYFMHKFFE